MSIKDATHLTTVYANQYQGVSVLNCKIDDDVISLGEPTQETPAPASKATAPRKASAPGIYKCDFCDKEFCSPTAKGGHTSRTHPNMGKTA